MTDAPESHWTLSFLIGTPIWILVLAITILFLGKAWRYSKEDRYDSPDVRGVAIALAVALVVMLAIIASPLGYYPYKADYHRWRTVQGPVTEINKRLISSDKSSMSERYVFKINGQAYGVDDTRASLVKVGDTVRLSCLRDWEYASVPGYVCRWDQ